MTQKMFLFICYNLMMADRDGISEDSNNERGMRETIKADYTKLSAEKPIEGSFRAVGINAHNLENVKSLRERYPQEYSRRMVRSSKEFKEENVEPGDTWAGRVLAGVSDNDKLGYVQEHFGEDMLGIPKEFLEIPEVKLWTESLVNRSWANKDVNEWLRNRLGLEKPKEEIKPTRIDATGFN